MSSHGGSVALSGYIFQLLSVTGIQLSAGPGEGKAPQEESFVVFHEWLDEDAAVAHTLGKTVDFIQVKYSQNGTNAKISLPELREIIEKFAKASDEAAEKNWNIGSYVLLSNRGLTPPAQKLLRDSQTALAAIRVKNAGSVATKPKTNAALWNEIETLVAACLVELEVTSDEVIGQLKDFAAKYGVLPHEFDDAIAKLMSKIFTEVANLRESGITLKDWIQMLTGNRKAVSLSRELQTENQAEEIGALAAEDPRDFPYYPREKTKNLFENYRQYSFFVFLGLGGMGKTASLADLARQRAADPRGPFIKGQLAIDAYEYWATECAAVWRKASTNPRDTINEAIERLQGANPDNKPLILFIALDGIDETLREGAAKDLHALFKILKSDYLKFRDVSECAFKLVVTCRDIDELKKYLPHDASDIAPQPVQWYKTIEFKPFDSIEFKALVKRDAKDFEDRLAPEEPISTSAGALSGGQIENDEQSAIATRYQYLRDPLIWREFVLLKPDEKKQLLEEKGNAASTLGERIFRRFHDRATRRNPELKHFTIFTVMKAAALEMEKVPYPWTLHAWCQAGTATRAFNDLQCQAVFREASEAGLIDGKPTTWTWRNPVIPLYLKNAPPL